MRLFLRLLVLTLLAGAAHAQDLLTKRSGENLLVKVVEITPAEVRYRRADNPDGPLISVWRTDVATIRYANGTQEVLNAPAPAGHAGIGRRGPPGLFGCGAHRGQPVAR